MDVTEIVDVVLLFGSSFYYVYVMEMVLLLSLAADVAEITMVVYGSSYCLCAVAMAAAAVYSNHLSEHTQFPLITQTIWSSKQASIGRLF